MTQEEKYRKALLEARAVLEPCLKYSNGKVREALDSIDKELKSFESEDEKIRKLLVWQVHRNIEDETNDLAQSVYDGIKGHDPDIEESIEDWKRCLAYLEKQKEQKPAECERQPEFKEVEYDFRGEKVKVMRPFFRDDKGREFSTTGQDTDLTWSVLREWCEIKGITPYDLYPRAEWSEEDEEMLDIVLTMVDCSTVVPHSGGQLHPSESYKKDISEWLKSLRPHWKPSEEH